MFINFTNHPSAQWSEEQKNAAAIYGEIVDIPFPNVPAAMDEEMVKGLCGEYIAKIMSFSPTAVLVQGEMTLAFCTANALIKYGITALCACSERCSQCTADDSGNTVKTSVFKFIRFRKYL